MHILTFVFCFDEFEGIAAWSHRHVALLAELLPETFPPNLCREVVPCGLLR